MSLQQPLRLESLNLFERSRSLHGVQSRIWEVTEIKNTPNNNEVWQKT